MRLIDADELPRFGNRGGLVHWKDIKNAPTIYIEERLNDAYAHGWSDAEAKYHDAVDVVRCKECQYVTTDATCCLVCGRSGMGLKPYHVYHDDFCSYGEREE